MGTGWDYFINVCRVLRAVISVVGSTIGIIVVGAAGWAIYQRFQPADSGELQVVAQPGAAAAAASQTANPQFKTPQTPAQSGTTIAPVSGTTIAPAPGATPATTRPNPQFKSTQPPPASNTGSRIGSDPYKQDLRPNPQFR